MDGCVMDEDTKRRVTEVFTNLPEMKKQLKWKVHQYLSLPIGPKRHKTNKALVVWLNDHVYLRGDAHRMMTDEDWHRLYPDGVPESVR